MNQKRHNRVEDYLAAIDQVCEDNCQGRASTGSIAKLVGVSAGTVSCVLKQLSNARLVEFIRYEGASLTLQGRLQARRTLRRHRLLKLFLVRTLGMNWESVADEAKFWEWAASDHLIELIDSLLAYPEFDPHGDPIPRTDGTLPVSRAAPLTNYQVGTEVVLQRIKSPSKSLLRFLREEGLLIGVKLKILECSVAGGVIAVESEAGMRLLGYQVATQIFVQEVLPEK